MKSFAVFIFLICIGFTGFTQTGFDSLQLQQRKQVEESLVLLANSNGLLPLQRLDTLNTVSLVIGMDDYSSFHTMLGNYNKVSALGISGNCSESEWKVLVSQLNKFNLIVLGFDWTEEFSGQRKNRLVNFMMQKSGHVKVIAVLFGKPETYSHLLDNVEFDGLVWAGQSDKLHQELSAQLIYGGLPVNGRLNLKLGNRFPVGSGIDIQSAVRLKYTIPEEEGVNGVELHQKVDSLLNHAISLGAFPGCNLLVAKSGKVIFHEAYGHHTYARVTPVQKSDLYDFASVTKIAGALPAIMVLNSRGQYQLDAPFSTYWPDWKKSWWHHSNKEDITVRELLAHQAGLVPYIPFWKESLDNQGFSKRWYRQEPNQRFSFEIAQALYLKDSFKKKVFKSIRQSEVATRGKYVYSCLSFIIVPSVVERITRSNYVDFLNRNVYHRLGAWELCYNPLQQFPIERIVPTEYDNAFRKTMLQGTVHDEAAAVMGGISGNAGLFGSANDLAKLLQMYMQKGSYGGEEFIRKEVFEEFTRVQFPENGNRRALGFDKPLVGNRKLSLADAYPAPSASEESFGHSGFTGTFVWVDPEAELVYILLTNRVYPTRENNMIGKLNVRIALHQLFYDYFGNSDVSN
jgi:CubicO group peptidase (beta-lactamase class C family)